MAKKNQSPVQQTAIGDGNLQIEGDYNTVNVNQTFFQKVINIFKNDAEVVNQRNRRIMLEHVENFWVKGFLEKSLYGAVLLELKIKESPDTLNYPWAIKRIPTKEILPAGIPMIEIFQEIGMRRSLLILGGPGSGKTIMLLELVRQLIERARQDAIETIPVVFNLSSWSEKLTLTDWLVRELTMFYTIPKKVASTWVKESKMLLLLDGLDEVRHESRNKCVEAINKFRKDNGLTSLVVCSRTEDYTELKTRLFFDGAIEIQPLTPNQVTNYFEQLGEEVKGIREVLEKDTALNEMTETPLFLNVMTLAYSNLKNADIIVSENPDVQRKHLFDAYINRMFERPERTKKVKFSKQEVLLWLSWLAQKMIKYNQLPFIIENMQPKWLNYKENMRYRLLVGIVGMLGGSFLSFPIFGLLGGIIGIIGIVGISDTNYEMLLHVVIRTLFYGFVGGTIGGIVGAIVMEAIDNFTEIRLIDTVRWNWEQSKRGLISGLFVGFVSALTAGAITGVIIAIANWRPVDEINDIYYNAAEILSSGFFGAPFFGLLFFAPTFTLLGGLIGGLYGGFRVQVVNEDTSPRGMFARKLRNSLLAFLFYGPVGGTVAGIMAGAILVLVFIAYGLILIWMMPNDTSSVYIYPLGSGLEWSETLIVVLAFSLFLGLPSGIIFGLIMGFISGLLGGLKSGGFAAIRHHLLRFVISRNNILPRDLIAFLDDCTDLIFLRRVGGGYMFIHRLLMEHFSTIHIEEKK